MTRGRLAILCAVLLVAIAAICAVLIARGGPEAHEGDSSAQGANAPSATMAGAAPAAPGLGTAAATPALPNADPAARPAGEPARLVRAVGRVVGEGRRPAAGVAVRLHVTGAMPLHATSGPDGSFAFELRGEAGHWRTVSLHVTAQAGLGGLARVGFVFPPVGDQSVDLGTVELVPTNAVSVRVLDGSRPVGGAVVQASVVADFALPRLAEAKTNGDGTADLAGLPSGWIHVHATSPEGRRGRGAVRLPREDDGALEVRLAEERTLAVHVIEDETDHPVPGASVEVSLALRSEDTLTTWLAHDPALTIAPTDEKGRSTVRGLLVGDAITVSASAKTHPRQATREVKPGATEVTLELPRPRTVRFRVESGETPVPADGTELRVREWPSQAGLPALARMKDGLVVVEGAAPGEGHGVAIAPDGSLAELHAPEEGDEGAPTSFRRPRHVDVVVREETGRGVAGIGVQVRGENGEPWTLPVQTDAEGRAVLHGLLPRTFAVHTGVTPIDDWGEEEEEVDLSSGDARVEAVFGAEREVVVHVILDGTSRLPAGFACGFADALVLAVREEPETGVVRLRVRPRNASDPDRMSVRGTGFEPGIASVPWGEPGSSVSVTVELGRTGTLVATVRARPGSDVYVHLLRPTEDGKWRRQGLPTISEPGEKKMEGLAPGTYRLHDLRTGLVVDGILVAPGGTTRATVDLLDAYEVSGRVRLPEGYDPSAAQVASEGKDVLTTSEYGRGMQVRKDGTFSVSVPGGRPVTLRVTHPDLDPAPKEDRVVVTAPRQDIVLALVERAAATFRLVLPAGVAAADVEDGWVELHAGEPTEVPASNHRIEPAGDGGWRFAGHRPGTWTVVWVFDVLAPRVQRGVRLPQGRADLGALAFDRGSTVRVRVVSKEGAKAPQVKGSLDFAGPPSYDRRLQEVESSLVFRGLGAGTFHANFWWQTPDGEDHTVEREITVDGRTDATIDLDVR